MGFISGCFELGGRCARAGANAVVTVAAPVWQLGRAVLPEAVGNAGDRVGTYATALLNYGVDNTRRQMEQHLPGAHAHDVEETLDQLLEGMIAVPAWTAHLQNRARGLEGQEALLAQGELQLNQLALNILHPEGVVRAATRSAPRQLAAPLFQQLSSGIRGIQSLERTVATFAEQVTKRADEACERLITRNLGERQFANRAERYRAWLEEERPQDARDARLYDLLPPEGRSADDYDQAIRAHTENLCLRFRNILYGDARGVNPVVDDVLDQLLCSDAWQVQTPDMGFAPIRIGGKNYLEGAYVGAKHLESPTLFPLVEWGMMQLRARLSGDAQDRSLINAKQLLLDYVQERSGAQVHPRPSQNHHILVNREGNVIGLSEAAQALGGLELGMDGAAAIAAYNGARPAGAPEAVAITPPTVMGRQTAPEEIVLGPDDHVISCSPLAYATGVRPGMSRGDAEICYTRNNIDHLTSHDRKDRDGRVIYASPLARAYGIRKGMTTEQANRALAKAEAIINGTYTKIPLEELAVGDLFERRTHAQLRWLLPSSRPAARFVTQRHAGPTIDGERRFALPDNFLLVDRIQGEAVVVGCSQDLQRLGVQVGHSLEEATACFTDARHGNMPRQPFVVERGQPGAAPYFEGDAPIEEALTQILPQLIQQKYQENVPRVVQTILHPFLTLAKLILQRIYHVPDFQDLNRHVVRQLIALWRSPQLPLMIIGALDGWLTQAETSIQAGRVRAAGGQGGPAALALPAGIAIRPEAITGDLVAFMLRVGYTLIRRPVEQMTERRAVRWTLRAFSAISSIARLATCYSLRVALFLRSPLLNYFLWNPLKEIARLRHEALRAVVEAPGGGTMDERLLYQLTSDPEALIAIQKQMLHEAVMQLGWGDSLGKSLQAIGMSGLGLAQEHNLISSNLGQLADEDMDAAKFFHQALLLGARELLAPSAEARVETVRAKREVDQTQKALSRQPQILPFVTYLREQGAAALQGDPRPVDLVQEHLQPLRSALRAAERRLREDNEQKLLIHSPTWGAALMQNHFAVATGILQYSATVNNWDGPRKVQVRNSVNSVTQVLEDKLREIRAERRREEEHYGSCRPSLQNRYERLLELHRKVLAFQQDVSGIDRAARNPRAVLGSLVEELVRECQRHGVEHAVFAAFQAGQAGAVARQRELHDQAVRVEQFMQQLQGAADVNVLRGQLEGMEQFLRDNPQLLTEEMLEQARRSYQDAKRYASGEALGAPVQPTLAQEALVGLQHTVAREQHEDQQWMVAAKARFTRLGDPSYLLRLSGEELWESAIPAVNRHMSVAREFMRQ